MNLSLKTHGHLPMLSKLKLDLSQELNDSAAIIKTDIQTRYDKSVDLQGNALAPLADSTIESKRRKGFKPSDKPLIATKNMWRNQKIDKATKTKQRAIISIGPTRDEIYGYHHEGNEHLPQRQTFGIGDGVEEKIDRFVQRKIDRILASL